MKARKGDPQTVNNEIALKTQGETLVPVLSPSEKTKQKGKPYLKSKENDKKEKDKSESVTIYRELNLSIHKAHSAIDSWMKFKLKDQKYTVEPYWGDSISKNIKVMGRVIGKKYIVDGKLIASYRTDWDGESQGEKQKGKHINANFYFNSTPEKYYLAYGDLQSDNKPSDSNSYQGLQFTIGEEEVFNHSQTLTEQVLKEAKDINSLGLNVDMAQRFLNHYAIRETEKELVKPYFAKFNSSLLNKVYLRAIDVITAAEHLKAKEEQEKQAALAREKERLAAAEIVHKERAKKEAEEKQEALERAKEKLAAKKLAPKEKANQDKGKPEQKHIHARESSHINNSIKENGSTKDKASTPVLVSKKGFFGDCFKRVRAWCPCPQRKDNRITL
jgi:hypothetical protein